MNYFSELKRRNVFKVGIAYLALAWVMLQIADVVVPALGLPDIIMTAMVVIGLIGFPFAIFFSWAFELTPDGIKREEDVDRENSIRANTGQKINYIIIGLLAIAVAFLLYDRGAPASDRANTIAVMPFADMSPDGSQEYFGDGIAEEILNLLVSVDELSVTSRTSSFAYKGTNTQIPEIAAELGVNYVVEGSIRTAGDTVRVTAQLIDVENDQHMWSETFDRNLIDIFAIQDEISNAITSALRIELVGGEIEREIPTQIMEAYDYYLQGHQYYYQFNVEAMERSIELQKRAIELDPNFAGAWAELGLAYNGIILYSGERLERYTIDDLWEFRRLSEDAAIKAVMLGPDNAFAWSTLGGIKHSALDFSVAASATAYAIELNPDLNNALRWRAHHFNVLGYADQAIEYFDLAIENDPELANLYSNSARTYAILGNVEIIEQRADLAIARDYPSAYYDKVLSALISGDKEQAIEYSRLFYERFNRSAASENVELYIDAYFNPELREQADAALLKDVVDDPYQYGRNSLLLHNGEIFVDYLESNLPNPHRVFHVFFKPFRAMLHQKPVKDHLQKVGYVDFWRANGFPFFCRPVGDEDFECQDGEGNWP